MYESNGQSLIDVAKCCELGRRDLALGCMYSSHRCTAQFDAALENRNNIAEQVGLEKKDTEYFDRDIWREIGIIRPTWPMH